MRPEFGECSFDLALSSSAAESFWVQAFLFWPKTGIFQVASCFLFLVQLST